MQYLATPSVILYDISELQYKPASRQLTYVQRWAPVVIEFCLVFLYLKWISLSQIGFSAWNFWVDFPGELYLRQSWATHPYQPFQFQGGEVNLCMLVPENCKVIWGGGGGSNSSYKQGSTQKFFVRFFPRLSIKLSFNWSHKKQIF